MNPDPVVDPATQGDLFMTMNIAMASQVGTRTSTPYQGYEVGQEYENTISSALIILAEGTDESGYTIKFSSGSIGSTGILGDGTQGSAGTTHDQNPSGIEPDPSHANTYKASFTFDRAILKGALTDTPESSANKGEGVTCKKYTIFVVANPTGDMVEAAKPEADLQQLVSITTGTALNDGVWKNDNFLMSSAVPTTHTIYSDEIAEGLCTTKQSAYNLGTVKVQRAMSRFDLDTDGKHMIYAGSTAQTGSSASELPDNIGVQFDAVAMVNMAKSSYLFKVMGVNNDGLVKNASSSPVAQYPIGWGDERESNFSNWWVATPDQSAYFNQMFSSFSFNSGSPKESEGDLEDFQDFFDNTKVVGNDWQLISSLTTEDNTYEHTGHTTPTDLGAYRIWRYAMENTNPWEAKNQVNGNSTGVIFRARLTGNKIPTRYEGDDEGKAEPIFAYNNVILGKAEDLFAYVTNNKAADDNYGIYPDVHTIVWNLLKPKYEANWDSSENDYEQKENNDWWIEKIDDQQPAGPGEVQGGGTITYTYHHGDLSTVFTAENLVGKGFTIYKPSTETVKLNGEGQVADDGTDTKVPVYYCYYIYWNRHNDNNDVALMGPTEFATVRNNVYKLAVSAIYRLGHPADPDDDPDEPGPGDKDEDDHMYAQIECKILPWVVRINDIEF